MNCFFLHNCHKNRVVSCTKSATEAWFLRERERERETYSKEIKKSTL
ncbi:MAG: hypothetical protein LBR10_06965 [Prevotellaceae bacterium]|nr:hypothetical protein [Prevotellaceae bacterium]